MNLLSLPRMFRTYEDTISYLYKNLPMFQRVGAVAYKGDLSNTLRLCEALGDPQKKFKSIHVAGTNGKGSTSHMLASVMQSAGYKTGLFTSPHLKEFTERIRINGQEVSREFIVDFVNRIRPVSEEISPSFFEVTVAMAFEYFALEHVDIAVVEVGLGGRLDSTNIITPEVSVITNIGWDHKDILGDTLEKIAAEKAGIMKSGVPVVVSERQGGIDKVFVDRASDVHTEIHFAIDRFNVIQKNGNPDIGYDVADAEKIILSDLNLPLQGFYQRKNLAGVVAAIDILKRKGWNVSNEVVKDGLSKVISQTGLKGRWQKLSERPLMICDTGHNIDGVKEILAQIEAQHVNKLHMVWGMVKDKEISDILSVLPKDANYYFCQARIPRALEAAELAKQAREKGLNGAVVPDVNEAIRQAKAKASVDDLIFIGGSTFVVAEIDNL